jgi:antitoxin component of RelBE/YafQ-DinJ toxin-antitoxin module
MKSDQLGLTQSHLITLLLTSDIQEIPIKISATQSHKAVRTIRFFINQRQGQAIDNLKNNPSSKWFLAQTGQLTYRQQTNVM